MRKIGFKKVRYLIELRANGLYEQDILKLGVEYLWEFQIKRHLVIKKVSQMIKDLRLKYKFRISKDERMILELDFFDFIEIWCKHNIDINKNISIDYGKRFGEKRYQEVRI